MSSPVTRAITPNPQLRLPDQIRRRLSDEVRPGAKLLVAVSGGADSVALAHVLKALPYALTIAHVNHQLRSGANADERFVMSMAKRWDIPAASVRIPVRSFAASHKMGLEEAARRLRYQELTRLARHHRCVAIVTAHHADDQAETVFMNILRGAGVTGFSGIAPSRSLAPGLLLLRPCLDVPRSALRLHLKMHRLSFRADPSNRDPRFLRNRIRRRTLPVLEKDHPGLTQRLVQTADIFRQEESFWQPRIARALARIVRQKKQYCVIDLNGFLGYHKALGRRILHALWPGLSFGELERLWALARSPDEGQVIQFRGLRAARRATTLVITTLRKT